MVKTRLWYFCGQTRNRRGKNHSDFQFWWTVRGSNPRPRRCERRALPAELTAQISHFSTKKVMKNGFLRYSILRGKSEKPNRKLEGEIGQVMEVHMDANAALSRGGKFSAHGLRHVGRLYNVRMDYNFLAKTRTANDALKVLHIRFIQLCLE